jgi:hypothetical protein
MLMTWFEAVGAGLALIFILSIGLLVWYLGGAWSEMDQYDP